MLIISILTIDPSRFDSFIRSHIVQRTQKLGLAKVEIVDIRDFAEGSFRDVDDSPIGGGRGLILRAEPVRKAIAAARGKSEDSGSGTQVIALTPAGKTYSQEMAHELSGKEHLILVCGHYEGMDARLAGNFDREISIGDYILTGGEIAAEAVADSVLRLLKGALREGSSEEESFENGLLEYPQYTQPADLSGEKVPEVLLSGDHARIHEYRIRESVRITGEKRPDLLKKELSRIEKKKSSGEPLTGDEKLIIETVQDFQTAASVLKHRLPHSAKPHPRILPQRGINMDVNRAFSSKEKKIVILVIIVLLVIVGLTRPMWSTSYKENADQVSSEASAEISAEAEGSSETSAETSAEVSAEAESSSAAQQ